eukprot:290789_1
MYAKDKRFSVENQMATKRECGIVKTWNAKTLKGYIETSDSYNHDMVLVDGMDVMYQNMKESDKVSFVRVYYEKNLTPPIGQDYYTADYEEHGYKATDVRKVYTQNKNTFNRDLDRLKKQISQQKQEIKQLKQMISEQQVEISKLRQRQKNEIKIIFFCFFFFFFFLMNFKFIN